MKQKRSNSDPVLAELVAIKKLLVFQLLAAGATQKEIGGVIGLDHTRVSRMFPSSPKALRQKKAEK